MSPLLASLALLALCWQSGVSRKVETNNYQNLGSFIVNVQPEVGSAIQAQAGNDVTMAQVVALLNLMPNTLLTFTIGKTGLVDKLEFIQKPLVFGYLCELNDPKLPGKLNEILYNGPPTAEDKQKIANDLRDHLNIDCAKNPPTSLPGNRDMSAGILQKLHYCFCKEDLGAYCGFASLLFAMHEKAAEAKQQLPAMIPCISETFPALLKAGSGALGATWKFLDKFGPETLNNAVSDNVEAFSTADMANILCDAVDPAVENALKAVYASNGAYWFAEMLMFAQAFPQASTGTDATMAQLCSEKAVIENAYGKCICKQDTGFTFCIYKVIAEYFVKEGYLTCDKADKTKQKFIPERKPRAIPTMVDANAKTAANATTAPANSTVGPSPIGAPTGGAATSSLTIASLAAAALLLLRQ